MKKSSQAVLVIISALLVVAVLVLSGYFAHSFAPLFTWTQFTRDIIAMFSALICFVAVVLVIFIYSTLEV